MAANATSKSGLIGLTQALAPWVMKHAGSMGSFGASRSGYVAR